MAQLKQRVELSLDVDLVKRFERQAALSGRKRNGEIVWSLRQVFPQIHKKPSVGHKLPLPKLGRSGKRIR